MRKSLAIIASALLLAVAATATHDRLRYDSTVFADAEVTGGGRAERVEYPPCIRGVREDRCIQLYERGVRRSYQRWLAAHGRGQQQSAAAGPRSYRPCRSRNDDRCQQGARATRTARAARPARSVRVQQAQRRPATVRRTAQARPAARPVQARAARATTVVSRPRVSAAPARPAPRAAPPRRPGGTPGI
jgi:hypothetical protein